MRPRCSSGLRHPRLVRLLEGPIEVGGRQALVLESAGDQTLGEVLRSRERLSLDLLERWGTDLLEALVALDRAGVDHRDIKPANLGVREVREKREDRAKHLVLFDFSLSSAAGTAVTAGTPPYLDPFLDSPLRGRYDSAAERYSAAVVLFEMATGSVPRFGDGLSDPGVHPGRGRYRARHVRPGRCWQPGRASSRRHWPATPGSGTTPPPKCWPPGRPSSSRCPRPFPMTPRNWRRRPPRPPRWRRRACPRVPCQRSSRWQSRPSVTWSRWTRSGSITCPAWPPRPAARSRPGRGSGGTASAPPSPAVARHGARLRQSRHTTLPDPVAAAGTARGACRQRPRRVPACAGPPAARARPRASTRSRRRARSREVTGVTRGRVPQQLGAIQDAWGGDADCRELLDTIAEVAWQSLADSGGVATVDELAQSVLAVMPPAADGDRRTPPWTGRRRACFGSHWTVPRRVFARTTTRREFFSRRRDGRIVLLAADQALLDPAEALGRAADELVEPGSRSRRAHSSQPHGPLGGCSDVWADAVRGLESPPRGTGHGPPTAAGGRAGTGRGSRRVR